MIKCTICNKFQCESKSGFAQHIIKKHNKNYFNYLIENNLVKIPNCVCGKQAKMFGNAKINTGSIRFAKSCGNKKCISKMQSEHRLKIMKMHPEKTAWRLKNLSYPEKVFKEKLEELEYDKKYLIVRERAIFPYFIDFAFENEKVAVEIDGSQHLLKDRKIKDELKDKRLFKLGWRVLRFPAKNILYNIDLSLKELDSFLNSNVKSEIVGLIDNKTLKEQNKKHKTRSEYFKNVRENNFNEIHSNRIKLINDCVIDFSKYGWVIECSKLLKIKPQKVNAWFKKYMSEFYQINCYKKKS